MKKNIRESFKKYHFEWKHLLVLFSVLIIFQLAVSYINKASLAKLINETQNWYKLDSAEKLANLTTTSIELLMETNAPYAHYNPSQEKNLIQAFNIIFSQQILQQNVQKISLVGRYHGMYFAIDNGQDLFDFFYRKHPNPDLVVNREMETIRLYKSLEQKLKSKEQIISVRKGEFFQVLVPLAPRGEYIGALYMRIKPDFGFIAQQITSNYDETALIFSILILFGLLAMFYISAYTVRERDEAQKLLFQEREKYLKEHIARQKEALFTKRIYHTHHKAEKIMGFIKEDLRNLKEDSIDLIKHRTIKYANFISRVIYDMKWYDPPLQTIRSAYFKTDLNEVVRFIVEAIFKRTSKDLRHIHFQLTLDERFPSVSINEFVVWEIIEPLIQNAVDHAGKQDIKIFIESEYHALENKGVLRICDNGKGILPDLLRTDKAGIRRLFLENISTKEEGNNRGYGCYLSYQIARRCGWYIDAFNRQGSGACFEIYIPFAGKTTQEQSGISKEGKGE